MGRLDSNNWSPCDRSLDPGLTRRPSSPGGRRSTMRARSACPTAPTRPPAPSARSAPAPVPDRARPPAGRPRADVAELRALAGERLPQPGSQLLDVLALVDAGGEFLTGGSGQPVPPWRAAGAPWW